MDRTTIIVHEVTTERDLLLASPALAAVSAEWLRVSKSPVGLWLPDYMAASLYTHSQCFDGVHFYPYNTDPRTYEPIVKDIHNKIDRWYSIGSALEVYSGNSIERLAAAVQLPPMADCVWIDFNATPLSCTLAKAYEERTLFHKPAFHFCFLYPFSASERLSLSLIEDIMGRYNLLPVLPNNLISQSHALRDYKEFYWVDISTAWDIVFWLLASNCYIGPDNWIAQLAIALHIPSLIYLSKTDVFYERKLADKQVLVYVEYDSVEKCETRDDAIPKGSTIPSFYTFLS